MKTMLKKLSAFSIGPIVAAFIGFINVPVITHVISTEEYGRSSMFVVAQSMIALVLYLGLDQAFVREFNGYRREKSKLIKNAMLIPAALSVLAACVILLFAPWISWLLFGSRTEIFPTAGLAIMLPFMVVYNFSLLNIRMQERGLLYSFFMIALKAATLLITLLLFFSLEKSFRSVVYAIAIAEILNGIAAGLFLVREIRADSVPAPVDTALIGRMLRFGIPLIPAALLVWAMTSMDKIMLRAMMTYGELGLYEAAFKIVNALGIVQTWFTLLWTPIAYRWHEEKRPTAKYSCVMKLVTVMMTVLCLLILCLKDLVAWVLGGNFAASIFIFPFLLLHPIMYTMSETTALGINFSRRTSFNILVSVVSGGANILLNYLLIPLWGGRGAAIATGLSYVVFFWMRSLISRGLWYRFPLTEPAFYSVLIVGNCLAHTFLTDGFAAYIISAFSLVLILILNVPKLKRYKEILTADDAVKEEALP